MIKEQKQEVSSEDNMTGCQEGKLFNKSCHPKLDSGSVPSGKRKLPWDNMLKQVQHDKCAFTHAEGATHVTSLPTKAKGPHRTGYIATNHGVIPRLMRSAGVLGRTGHSATNNRVGFTLAEVLITLGIIGVVAAITIPTLMTKINDKVIAHKKIVMEKKLLDGLNMLSNRENGLSVSYNNSEEFVRALSKYLKIVSICSNTELNKCFAYNKVNYDSNGETKQVDLTSITTAKKLKLEGGNWLDPAGFVMADGTPIIVSYNNDCATDIKVDPDKPSKEIPTACLDGLYDNNGARPQNKYGKDVLPFANAKIGTSCLAEPGGVCISSAPVVPPYLTKAECEAQKSTLGINVCNYDRDYWAGAMKMCKDQGLRLPTDAELAQLASDFYGTTIGATEDKEATLQTSRLPESFAGLGSSWYILWSSSEYSAYGAYGRRFYSFGTSNITNNRFDWNICAVCVGE